MADALNKYLSKLLSRREFLGQLAAGAMGAAALIDEAEAIFPGLLPVSRSGLTPPGTPVIWLKTPIAGLAHDDPVATWTNDGSAGGSFSGASDAASKPIYKSSSSTINGLATVYCGNDSANAPSMRFTINASGWSAATMYIIGFKDADPATSDTVSGWATTVSQLIKSHVPYTDGIIYDNSFTTVRKTVGDATDSFASPFYYGIFSTANDWRARMNGSEIFSTGTNTFEGINGTFEIGVSRESGGSRRASELYFSELLVYDSILSAGDFGTLEAYAAAKYAI